MSERVGSAMENPETAGSVFCSLLKELVDREDKAKASMEGRAFSVITVSGSFVTFLSALAAAFSGTDWEVPAEARGPYVAAACAFVLATVLAILTYAPRATYGYDVSQLGDLFTSLWNNSLDEGRIQELAERLRQLDDIQFANDRRGLFLLGAVGLQVAAVALIGLALLRTIT